MAREGFLDRIRTDLAKVDRGRDGKKPDTSDPKAAAV